MLTALAERIAALSVSGSYQIKSTPTNSSAAASETLKLPVLRMRQEAGVTANVVWYAVKRCARQAGIDNLAPHDLRRTCARPCHGCGGKLEQIQFLLGHASVQTTERYIGSKQKLQDAVNDRLGIAVASDTT